MSEENQTNAQQITDALASATAYGQNEIHARNTNSIKEVFARLEEEKVKLPDILFIKEFLPMFSGKAPIDNEKLKMWYTYSGGPFGEVAIMNIAGETIITIPPVLDRSILHTEQKNSNIPFMFTKYDNMKSISPDAAEALLTDQLIKTFATDPSGHNSQEELKKRWTEVIEFFSEKDPTKQTKAASSNFNPDDDVVY